MSQFIGSWPHQAAGPWVSCWASESVAECVQAPYLWLLPLLPNSTEVPHWPPPSGCWRTLVVQPRSKRELSPMRQL